MPKIMRLINIISRCQALYKSARLREDDLQPWHYNYVLPVCYHPGMTQEQLARHVCVDKCAVTRSLARLEEMGYVTRAPGQTDKRVMQVYPTDKMTELLPRVSALNREWLEYVTADLTAEELELLEVSLLKVARRAKEYVNSKDVIDG